MYYNKFHQKNGIVSEIMTKKGWVYDPSQFYFSRMKILIGVPLKSHFSRILFSR